MKLLVALAFVGLVGSTVTGKEFVPPIEMDYHTNIGIPAAARIKAAEEALDFDGARIVGGSAAGLGQYPYLGGVIITLENGATSVCGSSLVSNTRAVTAAHCWRHRSIQSIQFIVVFGSTLLFSGGIRITTTDVEVHADYDMIYLVNDIAMIRLSWVPYTDYIRNINVYSGSDQLVGVWAWAAGFGRTSDTGGAISTNQYLSHVLVQVITNAECERIHGTNTVKPSTICIATTGGHGTCGGDSGGPLVVNNQLIGITSFGHITGCSTGFPAGFVRVSYFAPWILARI